MTVEEIYEDIRGAYGEAAELLRSRLDELDKSYRLLKAGMLSEDLFRDIVGFSARTSAFTASDTLRRLGHGLEHNAHPEREAET